MLTIFTIPKSFKDPRINIIQRNAIISWLKLGAENEIILFGDEYGTAEVAREFNIRHVPEVKKNEFGTPLISDIFEKAQKLAKNDILAYANTDIILMSDFRDAVEKNMVSRFLLMGRRIDLVVNGLIEFEKNDWDKELRERVKKEGKLHGRSGIDYFVFQRGLWDSIPPFAIRGAWDNWLLYKAWSKNTSLVDATEVITAVHQNHDYSHIAGAEGGGYLKGPEAKINMKLAGGVSHLFTLRDADFMLTKRGLKKPKITILRFFYFPFHYFAKANLFMKILLFPCWSAVVMQRKLKLFLSK